MNPSSPQLAAENIVNKKWRNLPVNLYNYATQLSDYIQKKEYNKEDDFMTYQILYLKLKDIYNSFAENKVLINYIPEEELQAVFKRKLIRYKTQFIDLKNEFSFMLDQIMQYKRQKKMMTPINLSVSRESNFNSSEHIQVQQDSPQSKKDNNLSQSSQKKSIKTVLLILTAQFKENVKKIKPVYDEIVKLTPSLIENLQNTIQKQNTMYLQKQSSSNQNENHRGSFLSTGSNPSFNSSGFSISSSKLQESIESIMKSILQLAQSIKQQIREIESQTSNLEEFNEHLTKFKNNKVAFFNCIGAIEIYWMLRFDNVSVFFQQEIQTLQKGMDMFLTKLKQIMQKSVLEASNSSQRQKKQSFESQQQTDKQDVSRQHSITALHQENMSDASSYTSQELYYTAKSFQIPRYKISEQIALEQIPEEEQGKQSCTYTQSNLDHAILQCQSQQSDLESKYENDNQYNTESQSQQNEIFSFNSNFQFVIRQCENKESQFKSILSNSDIPKDTQAKSNQQENQSRVVLGQTQSIQMSRDQRDLSKSIIFSQDRKENNNDIQHNQTNSQQTTSTRSQANPSGQSEFNSGNQARINNKKEIQNMNTNDKYISTGYCFCISRVV